MAESTEPRVGAESSRRNRGRRAHRRWSVPIGRIAGIQIRVHATFALIVLLFWGASTAPDGLGLASGMLWLTLVFASVTAHELSHSIVARHHGIDVNAIVLLPIGGVSELASSPQHPRDEFAIAVVGPLASLGLAVATAGAALVVGASLWPPDLVHGALLPRLAWLNLLLGGFNLLPAFPMDGGRVLRSMLEKTRDPETATHLAARTGRVLAIAMMVVGVLWNPWLLFIGIFVHMGASAEEAATVIHERLMGITVRDVMESPPAQIPDGLPTVGAALPLEDALPVLGRADAAVVIDRGRVVGLIASDDVAQALREHAPGHGPAVSRRSGPPSQVPADPSEGTCGRP